MELKLGNRRLKLIDGKAHTVKLSWLGVEVKSGRFTPITFTKHNQGYAQCNLLIDGRPKKLLEHRIVYYIHNPDWDIWDTSMDNQIDHYNRKRDDNRIENLHIVNNQQNAFNRDAKGYHWSEHHNKWRARITVNYKVIYLGYFEKEEDAAAAYLEAKPRYHVIAALPAPDPVSPTD